MYYAQINPDGVVFAVTETHGEHQSVDMIAIDSLDTSLLGQHYANGVFTPPAPQPISVPQHATKRSFQNRFPKLANGMSTKWDAMCLFLADDGYAASLGVTGAPLYELRMLITTGVQRLSASPFVDMTPTGEAAAMTELLINPAIPQAFRLTAAERTAMMDTPLADAEIYKG
jgi:hypothetical protein